MIRAFYFDETDVLVVVQGLQLEALHGWAPNPGADLDEMLTWAGLTRAGDWRARPYGRVAALQRATPDRPR